MRILFCCEFYSPSVGGIQEMMRQVAERLVARGHEVTVVTSYLPDRSCWTLNGVTIKDFQISGSFVKGMQGDVVSYQQWVISGKFDLVMINMAQQWTLDALIPVLKDIRCRKLLIPCGFSCLHEPSYAEYYRFMPDVLRQFDHLIFHATDYRDVRFAKQHGIVNFSIIPNAASKTEFSADKDISFRHRNGIDSDELLFLTVGSFTAAKGHLDVAKAYLAADFQGRSSILLVNASTYSPDQKSSRLELNDHLTESIQAPSNKNSDYAGESWRQKLHYSRIVKTIGHFLAGHPVPNSPIGFQQEFAAVIESICQQGSKKRVLLVGLPRAQLVQAYMHADLFVFASYVECSPVVLFESAASGTPFLSAQVGNADEVAQWTGAGVIGPSMIDKNGYTRIDLVPFSRCWAQLVQDKSRLDDLGRAGKHNWAARFTWERIALEYERLFQHVCAPEAHPWQNVSVE